VPEGQVEIITATPQDAASEGTHDHDGVVEVRYHYALGQSSAHVG
jgi:hypothetical protein